MRSRLQWGATALLAAGLFALETFSAPPPALPAPLARWVQSRPRAISYEVVDFRTGEVLLQHEASRHRNPASLMKLLTTAVALDRLGPEFRFNTRFCAKAGLTSEGVLAGDLAVSSEGDPALTVEKLWRAVKDLKLTTGLTKITGDILVDQTTYQLDEDPFEGFEADQDRAFKADLMPFAPNFNAFAVVVTPSPRPAVQARVGIDPPVGWPPLKRATVQIVDRPTDRGDVSIDLRPDGIQVSGVISRSREPLWIYRSVADPDRYAEKILSMIFADHDIQWVGTLKRSGAPLSKEWSTILWREESEPLHRILENTNKWSLNLSAEHLFLALGRTSAPPTLSYPLSRLKMIEWLREKKLWSEGTEIFNGSGLSRKNRISASMINGVVREMSRMPEYLASLSILGVDGTGKLKRLPPGIEARIKTGRLADVRGVSGWLVSRSGRPLLFTAILNEPSKHQLDRWPEFESGFIEWLSERL